MNRKQLEAATILLTCYMIDQSTKSIGEYKVSNNTNKRKRALKAARVKRHCAAEKLSGKNISDDDITARIEASVNRKGSTSPHKDPIMSTQRRVTRQRVAVMMLDPSATPASRARAVVRAANRHASSSVTAEEINNRREVRAYGVRSIRHTIAKARADKAAAPTVTIDPGISVKIDRVNVSRIESREYRNVRNHAGHPIPRYEEWAGMKPNVEGVPFEKGVRKEERINNHLKEFAKALVRKSKAERRTINLAKIAAKKAQREAAKKVYDIAA